MSSPSSIRFDVFELRPESNELFKGGSKVKLKPQAARVLSILARRPGEAVEREEIRGALWGSDTFVDFDASLNSCITQLRSALGDDPAAPRYIETVPRHGYRFVGRLESDAIGAASKGRAWLAPAALVVGLLIFAGGALLWRSSPPHRAMLLVRPFENLSGEASQDFLGEGLTEELITRAAALAPGKLGVYGRTTSLRFAEGGLAFDYALEGSVRREGERIRITARLVDAAGGALWSETYDRTASNVLDLQTDIAGRVARALLPGGAPVVDGYAGSTASVEAHQAYLEGRHHLAEMKLLGLRLAAEAFERAVTLDPHYARAWAGLADAYNLESWWGGLTPAESARRGRQAAEKSLALAPDLAEAQDALGFVSFYYDFDFAEAESRFRQAIQLSPGLAMTHYWYAGLLSATGRHEEAVARMGTAQELDPLSPLINADAGWYYFYAGRYPDAIRECRRILALDPDYAWAQECVLAAAQKSGRVEDARASREELGRIFGAPKSAFGPRWYLERLESASSKLYVSPFSLALLKLELDDRAGALDALEKAFQERDGFLVYFAVDPRLEPLRHEPRFRALVGKLGLEAD